MSAEPAEHSSHTSSTKASQAHAVHGLLEHCHTWTLGGTQSFHLHHNKMTPGRLPHVWCDMIAGTQPTPFQGPSQPAAAAIKPVTLNQQQPALQASKAPFFPLFLNTAPALG